MIRIVLADDHKLFAMGVANLLKEEADFEVIGVFNKAREMLQFLQRNEIDLVITDMNMPGMDGLALIKELKENNIPSKVIVLSMYEEEEIFKKCVKEGVNAYVLKDADPDELIYTIKEVMEDRHIMNFQRVLKQVDEDQYYDSYKLKFKLSKRELEILKFISQGKGNKDIAEELFLSVHTIETHRKKIHQKLNVSTGVELVKKAMEMNL